MTTDKSAKVIIAEYNIDNPNLKRYVKDLKKSNKEMFEDVERLEDVVDSSIQPEGLVLGDSETFSIEKLMAETLEENYGVTSLDLLKD